MRKSDDFVCSDVLCEESPNGISRRGLFRGAMATAAAGGIAVSTVGGAFVETAYAATRTAPQTLVVLSLRGACDGLSLVVPYADTNYYKARPTIAIPSDRLLAKNGFYGLHPKLAPLLPLWESKRLAAVHAVGLPVANRSHFAAMEEMEDADPGSPARVGWLNRLLGRDSYNHPLQGIQFGSRVPSTQIYGPENTLSTDAIDSVTLAGNDKWDTENRRPLQLHTVWDGVTGPLGVGARGALQAVSDFASVRATPTNPSNGAVYPNSDLGKSLQGAARTIRADIGAEVITIDQGSWDMHVHLGTLASGEMVGKVDDLAKSLAAFFVDLGSLSSKVTVVTISEFGRRVKENSSQGLDHGWGTVMFLAGAGVRGGQVYGKMPVLGTTVDADVPVTTDYRSVLSEVVTTRFGVSSAQVFPGFTPQRIGVMSGVLA